MSWLLRAQDTFYVGTLKGVGRVHQQTVIDTYAKVAFAKLYDRKTPITAAEILNDRVVPFFDEHGIRLSRMLTDRGTEFSGTQSHEYELYLAVEDIDHSRTKTKSPQTNGICERFHRTVLDEFCRVAFRKRIYRTIDELQVDLDAWITEYNEQRSHQGRWCFGKTPMQTFVDALPQAQEELASPARDLLHSAAAVVALRTGVMRPHRTIDPFRDPEIRSGSRTATPSGR
jgi:hypothetical protein